MPREVFGTDYPFLPPDALLSFAEIERLAGVFAGLGVRKIRLTGGEPLLRKNLPDLIVKLAALPGIEDVALTTNGVLLEQHARALKQAGLHRVTVSLDALDDAAFRAMSDADLPVTRVLAGIEAAQKAGLNPVKVNAVVWRGRNEQQIGPLVRHFRGSGVVLRFIEYMDVGATNGARWNQAEVVPAVEIVRAVESACGDELVPLPPAYQGEVARRWRYASGQGEVGVIASVTQPFCGDCTRARLSAQGHLYTCLFAGADAGVDLATPLRAGADDSALARLVIQTWHHRRDRYSELRATFGPGRALPMFTGSKVEMSHIGG